MPSARREERRRSRVEMTRREGGRWGKMTPVRALLVSLMMIAAVARGEEPLERACGGAWRQFMKVSWSPIDLDRERVTCLLSAIGNERDQWTVDSNINILIFAHRPSAYDFFASQLDAHGSRVHHALLRTLVATGQPDAVRAFFAEPRPADLNDIAAELLFYAVSLHGTPCHVRVCSARLAESREIFRANLDRVELDLQAAADLRAAPGASRDEMSKVERLRAKAHELLLEVLGR
jgi:hypothetical protein